MGYGVAEGLTIFSQNIYGKHNTLGIHNVEKISKAVHCIQKLSWKIKFQFIYTSKLLENLGLINFIQEYKKEFLHITAYGVKL